MSHTVGMSRNRDARSIEAIAARLRATREALGLKQAPFADAAGVKRPTYNQWEKGKGRPGLDDAIKIADAHNLTLDWIYFGDASGLPLRLVGKIVLA